MERHVIITGGAGFIGSHLVDRLMAEGGWKVTVVDNFHPSYPRSIKESNIAPHRGNAAFHLVAGDVLEDDVLESAFSRAPGPDTTVVHLAALAGVRPSIADPLAYHRVNVAGTLKVLEQVHAHRAAHFLLASSSSVYGENPEVPWHEDITDLQPISPYAASKLAAEQFTRLYAGLHGLNTTVLRFFTTYGPRQRPDLAIHTFFRKIRAGEAIEQFGDGSTSRDYTFVGDLIGGIRGAMDRTFPVQSRKGNFEVFNLGHCEAITLRALIAAVEHAAGRKARILQMPEQPGDVKRTFANVDKAKEQFGYFAGTSLAEGLEQFRQWFEELEPILSPRTGPKP